MIVLALLQLVTIAIILVAIFEEVVADILGTIEVPLWVPAVAGWVAANILLLVII